MKIANSKRVTKMKIANSKRITKMKIAAPPYERRTVSSGGDGGWMGVFSSVAFTVTHAYVSTGILDWVTRQS